jgi:ABC-type polysaccharide/polyol phosphate export permease
MSSGRLVRYAGWQLRDFLMDRGLPVVLIGILLGYTAIEPMRIALGPGWNHNPAFPLTALLGTIVSPVISLAVFISLNGIISNDRKMGYFRFLFAKPIRPLEYYAQLYAVHFVGMLVTVLLLTSLFRLLVGTVPFASVALYTLIVYIAMGGIGFFVSASTRYDWLVLAAIWIGSRILRTVYQEAPDFRSRLVQILPPVHKIDGVATSLLAGRPADQSDMLWLVAYGALFFVLGLLVINHRSMVD